MNQRFCVDCGQRFDYVTKPGRPPIRCLDCRAVTVDRPVRRPKVKAPLGRGAGVGTPPADRMVRAYIHDGMTLEQIGTRHGLSRERVRQITTIHDPALMSLEKQRRRARTRLRRYVNDTRALIARRCRLCGEVFETNHKAQVFCDRFHHKVFYAYFRFHVDEVARDQQRKSMARYMKAKNPAAASVHYDNVLNDTVESKGRWLVFGSTTWHWAIRAYYCRWPVFDELPEQIRQQIIDHEGALAEVSA